MSEIAYLDGSFADTKNIGFLRTHALHYGTSVFEGIRVYDARPFQLEAHMERMMRSAEIIRLIAPLSKAETIDINLELIRRSGLGNCYLRPVMFRSGPDLGVYAPENPVSFGVLIWDWPAIFGAEAARRGIALTSRVPYRRPPPAGFPSEAKSSASYLIGAINRQVAAEAGYDDSLILTHDGFVGEASGANLFVVQDGVVRTPPPEGFLDGLTRQTVIGQLLDGRRLEVTRLTLDDVYAADEVFLTGTAYEIMPVRRIDDRDFTPGPVTLRIAEAFRDLTHSLYQYEEA